METFSALLAICAGNSPVPGEFPAQRPVTRNFDISLICARKYCKLNNREAGDLRRHRTHYGVIAMRAYSALKLVWHGWYWQTRAACPMKIETCHIGHRGRHSSHTFTPRKPGEYSCRLTGTIRPLVLQVVLGNDVRIVGTDPCNTSHTTEYAQWPMCLVLAAHRQGE